MSTALGSRGSGPAIASSTRPQSSAVRPIGPTLSRLQERAIAPCRLTRPRVGRSPVTPQFAAGETIEPHVSDPSAKGTSPALTAEADPLEEPPLQASSPHGERPGPVNEARGWRYPAPPA